MAKKEDIRKLIKNAYASNTGLALLITGRSGIGKTTAVEQSLEELRIKYEYIVDYDNKDKILRKVRRNRVIVFDEAHLCEFWPSLYPVFDAIAKDRINKILILITNRPGDLMDAVRNRCIQRTITQGDEEEKKESVINIFIQTAGFTVENIELLPKLTTNPREVVQLARTARILGLKDLIEVAQVSDYHLYKDTWVTIDEFIYLKFLEKHGRAAERTIKAALGWDSNYLREIEQSLLGKGLIVVESRGRMLSSSPQRKKSLEELL